MTDHITARALMRECRPTYDRDADEELLDGPDFEPGLEDLGRITEGHDLGAYFPSLPANTTFATRAEAIQALRSAYIGPDIHGIGYAIPEK